MYNVLIVIYLLVVLAMIAVILLQRSEGGALGIGGGNNGQFQVRSSANLLTRTTAILAALFFATAIGLTVLNEVEGGSDSILERAAQSPASDEGGSVLDALNALQGDDADAAAPADTSADAAPADADAPDLALPSTDAPADTNGTGN
jgi:preprotein translocase subunit SecG